jgi:hypothetical protein
MRDSSCQVKINISTDPESKQRVVGWVYKLV